LVTDQAILNAAVPAASAVSVAVMIQKTRMISKLVRAWLIRFFQLINHRQQQQGGLSYRGLSRARIFIQSSSGHHHGGTAVVPSEQISALYRQVVQLMRHLFAAAAGDSATKRLLLMAYTPHTC
jgi:hypothetical protein